MSSGPFMLMPQGSCLDTQLSFISVKGEPMLKFLGILSFILKSIDTKPPLLLTNPLNLPFVNIVCHPKVTHLGLVVPAVSA